MSKAHTLMCSLHQAGNLRDDECFPPVVHNTKNRLKRGEGIGRDLGVSGCHPADKT